MLAAARKKKEELMAEVYRILSITLGEPPKAANKFTFEYYDTDDKFQSWTGTPREFYSQNVGSKYAVSAHWRSASRL